MKNLGQERHFSVACSCPLNENVFLVFTKCFFFLYRISLCLCLTGYTYFDKISLETNSMEQSPS
jgi:hypothetical protein